MRQLTRMPWLRRGQWARFCAVYADPEELPSSYGQWLSDAQDGMVAFSRAGAEVHRVEVDVDEWVAWCHEQGLRPDGGALVLFALQRGLRNEGSRRGVPR